MRLRLLAAAVLAASCTPSAETPPVLAPRASPARPIAPAPPGVNTLAQVTLGAVGDVLMHGAVKQCAAAHETQGAAGNDGYDWLYASVADLLAAPDLTFANLETPIAPAADKGSVQFVFNAPLAAARALGTAGVDLVSVANNHAFDQGREGFLETLERLDAIGMPYVGAGEVPNESGPRVFEVNGLRLALLGYAQFFNKPGNECAPPALAKAGTKSAKSAGSGASGKASAPAAATTLTAASTTAAATAPARCKLVAVVERERAIADVTRARAMADAVIVSVHWGVEYVEQPRAQEVELAHALADAGALVVIGHHPHVLQPLELYRTEDGRTALIAYSLGNFISNQSRKLVPGVAGSGRAATRDSAILHATIARRDYGRGVVRTELTAAGYVPLWTENDTPELDRKRNPAAVPSIRVVAVERALAEVRRELAALPDPVPADLASRYVALKRREELYLTRRQAIAAVLGEDFEMTLAR